MTFISGYLGLLTSLGSADGTSPPVELAAPGYGRQPVGFSVPRFGVSKLASSYSFGCIGSGSCVGRALFSGPASAAPILLLPFGSGVRLLPGAGPSDAGDVGSITLSIPAMAAFARGEAFNGSLGAGGINPIGTVYDSTDEGRAPWSGITGPGGLGQKAIATGVLSLLNGAYEVTAGSLVLLDASRQAPGT